MSFFDLLGLVHLPRVLSVFKVHFYLPGVTVLLALQLCEVHGRHRSFKRAFIQAEVPNMRQTLLESTSQSGFRGVIQNVMQSMSPRKNKFSVGKLATKDEAYDTLEQFELYDYSDSRIPKPECVRDMLKKFQATPNHMDSLSSQVPRSDDLDLLLHTAAILVSKTNPSSKETQTKDLLALYYLSREALEHPSVESQMEESDTTLTKHGIIAMCLSGYQKIWESKDETVKLLAEAAFDKTKIHLPGHSETTIHSFVFNAADYYPSTIFRAR